VQHDGSALVAAAIGRQSHVGGKPRAVTRNDVECSVLHQPRRRARLAGQRGDLAGNDPGERNRQDQSDD